MYPIPRQVYPRDEKSPFATYPRDDDDRNERPKNDLVVVKSGTFDEDISTKTQPILMKQVSTVSSQDGE